jgi:hypothetical protein
MADLASYRVQLLARDPARTTDGARPLVQTGWQVVKYGQNAEGYEPVDYAGNRRGFTTDKEITGFEVIDRHTTLTAASTGIGGSVLVLAA